MKERLLRREIRLTGRRFSRLKTSLLVMLSVILTLGLMSCASSPKTSVNDLIWISPPNPFLNDEPVVKIDLTTQEVRLPKWYWNKIELYIFITESNIKKLHPD